jgi:hypothetical protein
MADETNTQEQQEQQQAHSDETQRLAAVGRGELDPAELTNASEQSSKEEAEKPQRPDHIPEKFWDAEKGELRTDALLKSYGELEKARQKTKEEADKAKAKEEGKEKETPEGAVSAELFTAARDEWAQSGDLSDETREKIISSGIPQETLDVYLEGVKALSEALTQKVYAAAGGEEDYTAAVEWARDNWSEAKVSKFDEALGDPDLMPVMVSALMGDYRAASPGEGKQTRQQGGGDNGDLYHDPEEFTRDLADADAKNDALARRKAVQKLQRSKKAGTLKHVTPRTGAARLLG